MTLQAKGGSSSHANGLVIVRGTHGVTVDRGGMFEAANSCEQPSPELHLPHPSVIEGCQLSASCDHSGRLKFEVQPAPNHSSLICLQNSVIIGRRRIVLNSGQTPVRVRDHSTEMTSVEGTRERLQFVLRESVGSLARRSFGMDGWQMKDAWDLGGSSTHPRGTETVRSEASAVIGTAGGDDRPAAVLPL